MQLEGRTIGRQLLLQLLARIHRKDAEAMSLCLNDDLTQAEAAKVLGVSRRTIGNRLRRVREAAAELLDGDPSS